MRLSTRRLLLVLLLSAPLLASAQLNRYYYYSKTQKLFSRGEYTAAIATINVFLDYLPNDDIALYLRALCKYNLDDFRGALLDLDRTLAHKPFMVETLVLRGGTLNQLGESDRAMKDLQLAIDLRPNDRTIVYLRGITHFLLDDFPKAKEDFTTTLLYQPKNLDARLNRGTASLFMGDTAAALQDYQMATHTNPYSAAPYISIARIQYAQKKLDEALLSLDEALKLAPKSQQALLVKALVLHDQGHLDEAISTLTQSLALAPKSSLALYNRALMYGEKGEWGLAIADYEAAARISPTNVFIRFNSGIIYLQQHDYFQAIESFTHAITLYPNFARAYALRGEARLQTGDRHGAKSDLDSAELLVQLYKEGELDQWSDTSANFSRLFAFEADFAPQSEAFIPPTQDYTELLPLATILVAQTQRHVEWSPVNTLNAQCGAPFFTLEIPREDTAAHLDMALFPPLNNLHAINLVRAITLSEALDYQSAISLFDSIPKHSDAYPLAQLAKAATMINQIRFEPTLPTHIPLSGFAKPAQRETANYDQPIAILTELSKTNPSPYIDYTLATAYYLSRDLPSAEETFTRALEAHPKFAEALFNRALVRILLNRGDEACMDLSVAGELGIDQAYRVISKHCTK